LNWLAASGTGILVAALLAGMLMGVGPTSLARAFAHALYSVRFTVMTIAAMLALGYVMRYSGMDATLGLAFARTGVLYPFFGTLIGWVGTATTGSDTASNVVFGSLQQVTARQIGVSPVLMASANSAGGVMGKMIAAPSIVVASTATESYGQEGTILRFVFWHSLALAALVGLLVLSMAYIASIARLVAR
jgi:lactate permease